MGILKYPLSYLHSVLSLTFSNLADHCYKVSLYLHTFLPPISYNSFDQLEDFERPIVLLQSYLSIFERLICCL